MCWCAVKQLLTHSLTVVSIVLRDCLLSWPDYTDQSVFWTDFSVRDNPTLLVRTGYWFIIVRPIFVSDNFAVAASMGSLFMPKYLMKTELAHNVDISLFHCRIGLCSRRRWVVSVLWLEVKLFVWSDDWCEWNQINIYSSTQMLLTATATKTTRTMSQYRM